MFILNKKLSIINYQLSTNSGQSLVEMMVAVAVVSMVLVGLISAITFSLANAQFSRNKTLATKYSQEAIEWLRNERDKLGWAGTNGFYNKAGDNSTTYCLNSLTSWPAAGGCAGTVIANTIFTRDVFVDGNGGAQDQVSVKVTVTWPQGSRTGSVVVDTYLNKWQ